MHSTLLCFTIIVIVKVMSQSSHCHGDLSRSLQGALFVLAHFKVLHFITNHFPSCVFPSIANDIHIISPPLIASFTYEHFQIEFHVMGFPSNLKNALHGHLLVCH
jgi:hypothetical protein